MIVGMEIEYSLLIVIIFAFNIGLTKDFIAPPTLIAFISLVTFGNLFVPTEAIRVEVYAIFLIIQIVCLIGSIHFFSVTSSLRRSASVSGRYILAENGQFHSPHFIKFWLFSIPGILALFWMCSLFGGYQGLLEASKFKNRNFAGLGFFLLLITSIFVVNLLHFAYTLRAGKRKYWVSYSLHFGLFVLAALIFTSRGTLLGHVIVMGIIWHLGYRRVSKRLVFAGGISLLAFASVLSVIRELYHFGADGLSFGIAKQAKLFRFEWADFGIFPLQTLINASSIDLQLGSTYAAALTNFVPRSIWPEKPPGGGEVFTKGYTNLYDSYSHYSSGLYPEAILNFGLGFGVVIGTMQFVFLVLLLTSFYVSFLKRRHLKQYTEQETLKLVVFAALLWYSTALVTSEFAHATMYFLFKVLVVGCFSIFVRIRFKML